MGVRGAVRASQLAKKSKDKSPGVFLHHAFDFDTPGPWNTAQTQKNNKKKRIYERSMFSSFVDHDLRLRICMIFHADSESDLKTSPNQVKNMISSKSDFYGTSTLNLPYGSIEPAEREHGGRALHDKPHAKSLEK